MIIKFTIQCDLFKYPLLIEGENELDIYEYLGNYLACNEKIIDCKKIKGSTIIPRSAEMPQQE